MPDFTPEQLDQIRFCLDNWERIDYLKRKKVFDFRNGSITINYKPLGDIQSVHYQQMDNECERGYPQILRKKDLQVSESLV